MKKYLLHNKVKFSLIILLKIIYAAGYVGFALILQYLVNLATANGTTTTQFFIGVGYSIAYIILVCGFMMFKDKVSADYVNTAVGLLRKDLSGKLLNISYGDFAENDSALYLSRLTNDMKTIGTSYFSSIMALPDQFFTFVFATAVAFYINYVIALVMLGLTLLILIVPVIFNKPLNKANNELSDKIKAYTQILKETFLGIDVVKNFNAQDNVGALIEEANARLVRKNRKIETLNAFTMNTGIFIVVLLQMGSIAVAGYMYLQDVILIGAVIAVVQLGGSMYQPLMETAAKAALISGVRELNHTVLAILDKHTETETRELPSDNTIEVSDLHYSYSDGVEILKGVNARFDFGKKYLIVGNSGSGKSTLLKLIGKMYSGFDGVITLGGVEYSMLTDKQLYSRVSIAQQSSYVFERSVRDNIDFNNTRDDELLNMSIRNACLENFIEENGIDTVIDEEVNQISGGEKQRIGLARALYRNNDILLLDEITSSLDKKTARQVESNILKLHGKTVINVSHKLYADIAALYDKILILENGVVRAFDEPSAIMSNKEFARLIGGKESV